MISLALLLLTACTEEEAKEVSAQPTEEVAKDEPTQEELNAKLITDAVPVTFIEANGDGLELYKRVKVVGEVSSVWHDGSSFLLTTTEGEGFGKYNIVNMSEVVVKEGQQVTVYGSYNGKDDTGVPEVVSTVIE